MLISFHFDPKIFIILISSAKLLYIIVLQPEGLEIPFDADLMYDIIEKADLYGLLTDYD